MRTSTVEDTNDDRGGSVDKPNSSSGTVRDLTAEELEAGSPKVRPQQDQSAEGGELPEEHLPRAWRCRGDIAADEIIDENMAEMRKDAHIDNWLCDQLSDRVRAAHSKSFLEPPRRARPSDKLPG